MAHNIARRPLNRNDPIGFYGKLLGGVQGSSTVEPLIFRCLSDESLRLRLKPLLKISLSLPTSWADLERGALVAPSCITYSF
jgi:hypothetical protein